MQGLSFREYLRLFHQIEVPAYSMEEILNHKAVLPGVDHPLPLFQDYLQRGYYPFGRDEDFEMDEEFKEKKLPLAIKIILIILVLAVIAVAGFFIYRNLF